MYLPRDERFGHLKSDDFLAYNVRAVVQALPPALGDVVDKTPLEFDTFNDVLDIYQGGIQLPNVPFLKYLVGQIPFPLVKELLRTDGGALLRLPTPSVIKGLMIPLSPIFMII